MNKLRAILGGLLSTVIAAQIFLVGSAFAAPGAVVSVEISPTSAGVNTNVSLRFYLIPTDTTVNGVQFRVNLSNLTYLSYSASGTAFSDYSGAVTGGSAGSTTFEIAAVKSSGVTSGTKAYIGQVSARTASSSGTASVSISEVSSADPDNAPVPSSAQNATITITAPVVSNPGNGGGDGNTTPPPAPSTPSGNVIRNPNPDSNVAIPGSNNPDEPNIVPEQNLADVINNEAGNNNNPEESSEGVGRSFDYKKIVYILLSLLAVATAGFAGYRIWDFRRNSKFHPPTSLPQETLSPSPSAPVAPTAPVQPLQPQGPITQEPTVITPTTQASQPNGSPTDEPKV